MSEIQVQTQHPYPVLTGVGALDELPRYTTGAAKVAVVYPGVLADVANRVTRLLRESGVWVLALEAPDGEAAKTPASLQAAWEVLADTGFTRSDMIVGLGGGATTDLAGFIAATWLRGIAWVAVPTTVLAMVDAGIGGKTGIDLDAGKNLVGAFHEPDAVLEDLELLRCLPSSQVRSGFGEIVKHGFIADQRTLELIEQDPADALDPSSVRLGELIRRSVRVKAQVVSGDLREATSVGAQVGREALNYGHTLGHAIEAQSGYRRRHGECVALGMIFAAELSARLLGLDRAVVQRHREILSSLGLPTSYSDAGWASLRPIMARDKKARGEQLRFVGLRSVGQVEIIADPPEKVLIECLAALAPRTLRTGEAG